MATRNTDRPKLGKGEKPFNIYESLPADIANTLWSLGERTGKDYGMDADDLVQVAWEWIGNHPAQGASTWWYDSVTVPGVKHFGYKSFRRDIGRVMAAHARVEKVKLQGEGENDQLNYSRYQIEMSLPYVWHSEVLAETQPDRPNVSTSNDPKYGGNAQVQAIDVRIAYSKIINSGSDWEKILYLRYGEGWTQDEIALEIGVSRQRIGQILNDALRALAKQLNGSQGFGRTYSDPEKLNDGPGSRKAMSNLDARRLTDSQ
jgi:RNA polymerase sigma factor (sigma-70 family)